MNMTNSIKQAVRGLVNNGKRVFTPRPSGVSQEDLLDALSNFSNMSFDSLGDFMNYYKSDYFRAAYLGLDSMTCYQIAMTNPYISAAIDAIAMPIAAAPLVAVPNDPLRPDKGEIEYLNSLMREPNPYQSNFDFDLQLTKDVLTTGRWHVEIGYNESGYPAALYRVPPHHIKPEKTKSGRIVFVNTVKDYVYSETNLLNSFNPNPFSMFKGLSPIVSLFMRVLLDESLMEHNLSFYKNDSLKGIISLSDKLSAKAAETETQRMQEHIKEMKRKGETGHLVMYGANFQSISATNRDMLTPDIEKSNINAVAAVYHVPPAKIMQIDTGNIGAGTGESQDETMNETLLHWSMMNLSPFNGKLLNLAGIKNTHLSYKNLTKKDEMRLVDLNEKKIMSGQVTINEVRVANGNVPYPFEYADQPLVKATYIPIELIEKQRQLSYGTTPLAPNNATQNFDPLHRLESKIERILAEES